MSFRIHVIEATDSPLKIYCTNHTVHTLTNCIKALTTHNWDIYPKHACLWTHSVMKVALILACVFNS